MMIHLPGPSRGSRWRAAPGLKTWVILVWQLWLTGFLLIFDSQGHVGYEQSCKTVNDPLFWALEESSPGNEIFAAT